MNLQIGNYRNIITRTVMIFILICLIQRYYGHVLPFQLQSPIVTKAYYDLSYWIFKLLDIQFFVMNDPTYSILFGILLFLSCIVLIIIPDNYGFAIMFTILIFLMSININLYIGHSMHYLGTMVIVPIAFWARSKRSFALLWEGVRYYACWVYASAFIWKIVLGAFWQWDAGVLTFKNNFATFLYLNPTGYLTDVYYWFLDYPALLNIGHKIVLLAESVFIIGFFTKKMDRWLILAALFIFLTTLFFADVFFIENLIIIFTFVSVHTWQKLSTYFPMFNKAILKSGKE